MNRGHGTPPGTIVQVREAKPGSEGSARGRMTQKRLAALAGVHPSTVSLALADDPRLPAPTRERVKRLALEHRYAPNPAARWLRHARTGTLGLVFWGEAHLEEDGRAYVGLPLMAAVEAAVAAGHQALVIPATRERLAAADEPGIEALVRRAPIDGAVFFGTTHDREGLARLVRSGFPAVHFGMRALRGADLSYAAADYRAGSRAAVAHLIAQGHSRVAMVEDPRFVAEIGVERSAGYADALAAAGITREPELLVRAAALDERRVDCPGVLARLREVGATAAFCTTGILGIELLRACTARGVRVPEGLALAAFDDEPEAATTAPPLTAVRQPVARIAAAAVALLLRLAAGEDVAAEERHLLLPPELIVRASSLRSAAR